MLRDSVCVECADCGGSGAHSWIEGETRMTRQPYSAPTTCTTSGRTSDMNRRRFVLHYLSYGVPLSILMLVGLCTWQSIEMAGLQKENTVLTYKVSVLSSINTRCDDQVTQCWSWRARMEIELKAYTKDCRGWLRKQGGLDE
jgi:hypothetical protein